MNFKQEKIRKQNKQLRTVIEGYLQQIERLKQVNQQHQAQIQTLLKFNERLLTIIETELNNYSGKRSDRSVSLQPISQITQKDSDMMQIMQSIKNHGLSINIKQAQLEQDNKNNYKKDSGNQTDRVMLGKHLEDQLSYEMSKSEYQKQLSQYSRKDKYAAIINLISTYKQQFGDSIQECDQAKKKIRMDAVQTNKHIQNIQVANSNFYDSKIINLNQLKQKLKENNPKSQLEKIMMSDKYSASTQNKLMQIMGAI